MARKEWLMGSATFLVVIVAGFVSATSVERHYATELAEANPGTACVGKDGSWQNWVWANVPALSPECK